MEDIEKIQDKRIRLSVAGISFAAAALILGIVFWRLKLVPFSFAPSASCLAYDDAYFQFIDFLALFKDVLSGKQSLGYSFSNYLGQSDFALFTYYLGSPFNLLLVFFDKSAIPEFFDIVILLRLSLCAFTVSWFLSERYKGRLPVYFNVLLSVGYGLMQYNLHQAYNINYLDGMYMLPLMMLGVYRTVKDKRTGLLSVTAGLSILFNWYTGCVNCVFSFFYFVLEAVFDLMERPKEEVRYGLYRHVFNYARAMFAGVLISAVYFVPSMYELTLGKAESGIDWYLLKDFLKGDPFELIGNYYVASGKDVGGMTNTFFCGLIVLIGVIGVFSISKDAMPLKRRLVYAGLLVFTVFMYYFGPLYMLFSLLKQCAGHQGRYLYLGSFIFVYMAGRFFCHLSDINRKQLIISVSVWLFIYAVFRLRHPVWDKAAVIYTGIELIVLSALLLAYMQDTAKRKLLLVPLFLLAFAELGVNTYRVLDMYDDYREYPAAEFARYERSEQEFIDRIKAYDGDFYRINRLQNRDMTYNATTANYNEALAFGYASAEGYTSTPHGSQLDFLSRGGYRNEGATPSVVSETSVIPLDSLLGVKYILSPFAIRGYEKVDDLADTNGKDVYLNPHALPAAFKIGTAPAPVYSTDPFEYHQGLVSSLTWVPASFYEPVSFTVRDEEGKRTYELELFDGNYAFFGYIPWNDREMGGTHIDINGRIKMAYSAWNSEDLFYIPVKEGEDKAYVTLDGHIPDIIECAKFYALDLDAFDKAVAPLKEAAPDELKIENGSVYIRTGASEGQYLFTSIPADRGWKVRLNGSVIKPETFEGCFMMIPLVDGDNEIVMEYHIPFLPAGIFLTCVGAVLVLYRKNVLKSGRGGNHNGNSFCDGTQESGS